MNWGMAQMRARNQAMATIMFVLYRGAFNPEGLRSSIEERLTAFMRFIREVTYRRSTAMRTCMLPVKWKAKVAMNL